mgnify:CR=1 FL=1
MAAQTLDDLPTPALILDRAVLRRNLKRKSERLAAAGVMLRPHVELTEVVATSAVVTPTSLANASCTLVRVASGWSDTCTSSTRPVALPVRICTLAFAPSRPLASSV